MVKGCVCGRIGQKDHSPDWPEDHSNNRIVISTLTLIIKSSIFTLWYKYLARSSAKTSSKFSIYEFSKDTSELVETRNRVRTVASTAEESKHSKQAPERIRDFGLKYGLTE